MDTDIRTLEPLIHAILTAPGTDLQTVSAKRVRRELLAAADVPVDARFLRDNKVAIDELIASVFTRVSAAASGESVSDGEAGEDVRSEKRKREEADAEEDAEKAGDDEGEEQQQKSKAVKIKKKSKASRAMSDAEIAQQLSEELNGRPRSSRAGAVRGRGRGRGRGGAGRGGKARSADTVDSDDESTGQPKKRRGGGGFSTEYILRCAYLLSLPAFYSSTDTSTPSLHRRDAANLLRLC